MDVKKIYEVEISPEALAATVPDGTLISDGLVLNCGEEPADEVFDSRALEGGLPTDFSSPEAIAADDGRRRRR